MDELRVKRIVLVDDDGNERAVLGTDQYGATTLQLTEPGGMRVELTAGTDFAKLAFRGREETADDDANRWVVGARGDADLLIRA